MLCMVAATALQNKTSLTWLNVIASGSRRRTEVSSSTVESGVSPPTTAMSCGSHEENTASEVVMMDAGTGKGISGVCGCGSGSSGREFLMSTSSGGVTVMPASNILSIKSENVACSGAPCTPMLPPSTATAASAEMIAMRASEHCFRFLIGNDDRRSENSEQKT